MSRQENNLSAFMESAREGRNHSFEKSSKLKGTLKHRANHLPKLFHPGNEPK
jgi:hypothetical protein